MKENRTVSLDELRESLVRLANPGSPDDTQEIGEIIGALGVAIESYRGLDQKETAKVRKVLHALKDVGYINEEVANKYLNRLDQQENVNRVCAAVELTNNGSKNETVTQTQRTIVEEPEPIQKQVALETIIVAKSEEEDLSEFTDKHAEGICEQEPVDTRAEWVKKKEAMDRHIASLYRSQPYTINDYFAKLETKENSRRGRKKENIYGL